MWVAFCLLASTILLPLFNVSNKYIIAVQAIQIAKKHAWGQKEKHDFVSNKIKICQWKCNNNVHD